MDGTNTLSLVSVVAGALAIIGHGCCCLPLISYIAPFFVIALEVTAIGAGFMARSQADPDQGDPVALVGIALGIVAGLLSLVFVALWGSLIVAYIGLLIAGNN